MATLVDQPAREKGILQKSDREEKNGVTKTRNNTRKWDVWASGKGLKGGGVQNDGPNFGWYSEEGLPAALGKRARALHQIRGKSGASSIRVMDVINKEKEKPMQQQSPNYAGGPNGGFSHWHGKSVWGVGCMGFGQT